MKIDFGVLFDPSEIRYLFDAHPVRDRRLWMLTN